MRHLMICLSLLILFAVSHAVAQDNKAPSQKPATTPETQKVKSEVDRMLEEAAKRGETIVGSRCIGDCGEVSKSATDQEVEARVLRLHKPRYPDIARAAHASGEVEVKIIIDTDGQVIAASAIGGHPLLQSASVEAARDALFSPTLIDGKPVKVVGVIKYDFRLE